MASHLDGFPLSSPPLVSTFHSFCVRLLRRDGDGLASVRPGFTRQFSIYDAEDQLAIVKSAYRQLGLDEKTMPYRATLSQISQAKSQKKSPQEMYSESADPRMTKIMVITRNKGKALRQVNKSWISMTCCSKASAFCFTIRPRVRPGTAASATS